MIFDIKNKEISMENLDLGGDVRFFDITQNGTSIVYIDSSGSNSILMYATKRSDHWDKFLVDRGDNDVLKGARFYYSPHLSEFNKTMAVAYFDINTMKIIVAEKDSSGVWHFSLPFGDLEASPDFAITYDEHGVLMLLTRGNDNRLYFANEVTSGWNSHKILDVGDDVGFNPFLLMTDKYVVGIFYNLSWRSIGLAERRKPYLNDYGVMEENWTQSLLYFSGGASLNYQVKYLGDGSAGIAWQKDNKVFYREFILR